MSDPGFGDTTSIEEHLASPPPEKKPDHILVVDDDDGIRQLLVSQIKAVGYPCRSAVSGEEALDLVVVDPRPALVVSDVQMPGLSGIELLQQLKQLDPHLQVVMVSGHHDMAVVRQALRDGAYDYLIKPFELEELSNTMARALEHQSLLKQNEAYRLNLEKDGRSPDARDSRDPRPVADHLGQAGRVARQRYRPPSGSNGRVQ